MKRKLLLLALTAVFAGCNEKVDPSLDQGAASGDPTTVIPPDTYIFGVESTSATMLNYKLHRTGPGNAAADCKISQTSALTNSSYITDAVNLHDSKKYDITCFYEAEELSMYYSGIDFKINASKNTCEYVAYLPFSFYQYQPGSSSASFTRINCGAAASPSNAGAVLNAAIPQYNSNFGGAAAVVSADCNVVVDTSIGAAANRSNAAVAEDQHFCRYDYSTSGGPNCDTGTVTVNEIDCAVNTVDGFTYCSSGLPKTIECAGEAINCVDGPLKLEISDTSTATGALITETVLNEDFSNSYTYEGGMKSQDFGNYFLANYRRDLANAAVDFVDHSPLATYIAQFGVTDSFNPTLVTNFAANKRMDGTTPMVVPGDYTTLTTSKGYTSLPLAADPFMGYGSSANRTNPFYTFYCLDRAYDIKARIRMVVRDWDRVFSTTSSNLELLTDLPQTVNSRQDNDEDEIVGDLGRYNNFNDREDWDNFIFMTRTTGVLAPAVTVWEPESGFFDTSLFLGASR